MTPLEKEAAGELTARTARWLSTPIKGTPKLIQKVRSSHELDLLEQGVRDKAKKYVEDPLRRGMTNMGVNKVVAKAVGGATAVANPSMLRTERQAMADKAGRSAVSFASRKPHVAVLGGLTPVPGAAVAVGGLEKLKDKFLNSTPGLSVGRSSAITPPKKGGVVSGTLRTVGDLEKTAEMLTKLAKVYAYQQKTQWSCSAACLKAVMGHHGVKVSEKEAVKAIGARPKRGAETDEIANAARQFGFEAFEYSFDSLDQARLLTSTGIPIICDIQSFNNPGKGHYVVMVSIDKKRVQLMDPNVRGNWRTISRAEMTARWWDRAMKPPHELMPKWGIVLLPQGSK